MEERSENLQAAVVEIDSDDYINETEGGYNADDTPLAPNSFLEPDSAPQAAAAEPGLITPFSSNFSDLKKVANTMSNSRPPLHPVRVPASQRQGSNRKSTSAKHENNASSDHHKNKKKYAQVQERGKSKSKDFFQ